MGEGLGQGDPAGRGGVDLGPADDPHGDLPVRRPLEPAGEIPPRTVEKGDGVTAAETQDIAQIAPVSLIQAIEAPFL